MRVLPITPYVVLILVAQAALDATPAVVAEREGGIGLGSALILAQAVQIAAVALGAVAAAYLIDRRLGPTALLVGALLFYAGVLAVGLQPMGALTWVLVAQGMAGAGFGIVLTASFVGAAAIEASVRPIAILLLLLAPLAARSFIGVTYLGGPLALTVAGAVVVALSVLVARLADAGSAGSSARAHATSDEGRAPMSSRAAVIGGLMVAVGILAALSGADPSRVSAMLLAGSIGMGRFELLDAMRAAMLVVGLVLVIGGAYVLLVRQWPDRQTLLAVPAMALAAFAGGGMLAVLSFAALTGAAVPGERTISAVSVAATSASALGLALGAVLLARGSRPRVIATAGGLVLACATVVGLLALRGPIEQLTVLAPLAAIALVGLAGGITASALRLVLADAAAPQRGLAAAAGVIAASFGSMLGLMIGNGEGVRLVGERGAIPLGLLTLVVAAVAAAGVAGFVAPSRPPANRPITN